MSNAINDSNKLIHCYFFLSHSPENTTLAHQIIIPKMKPNPNFNFLIPLQAHLTIIYCNIFIIYFCSTLWAALSLGHPSRNAFGVELVTAFELHCYLRLKANTTFILTIKFFIRILPLQQFVFLQGVFLVNWWQVLVFMTITRTASPAKDTTSVSYKPNNNNKDSSSNNNPKNLKDNRSTYSISLQIKWNTRSTFGLALT